MKEVNLSIDINEAYAYMASTPGEAMSLAIGILGMPASFHVERFKGYELMGEEFMKKYANDIYIQWSSNTHGRSALFKEKDNLCYFVDTNNNLVGFWYKEAAQVGRIQQIVKDLEENFLTPRKKEDVGITSHISFLLSNPITGELQEISKSMDRWTRKPDEELKILYGNNYDKFLEFVEFMNEDVGLAILQGEAGSGKTSIIRDAVSLIAETEDPVEVCYLTADNLRAIGSPEFISYFIRNSGRCLICEDSEPVLQKSNVGGKDIRSASTSNLLNLTDGILGDVAQTSVVATLNCDIELIDPALIRSGRCKMVWEINKLEENHILRYWDYKYSTNPKEFIAPVMGLGAMTIADFNRKSRR